MARRLFFVDQIEGRRAEITGDDALHLSRVLRVEPGQVFQISDQRALHLGEVIEVHKQRIVFAVLDRIEPVEALVRISLYAAILKFDPFEWMIEKATELGVERIVPVVADRCDKALVAAAAKRGDRWRKILRESAQQCRRWRPPVLESPLPFSRALACAGHRLFLAEEPGAPPILAALPPSRTGPDSVAVLIGPEGGWNDSERSSAAAAGWTPVSLGSSILRGETAAIAAVAILGAAWASGTISLCPPDADSSRLPPR